MWEYGKTSWLKLDNFVVNLDEVQFVKGVESGGIEIHFKDNHVEFMNRVSLKDFFSLLSK